MYTTYPKGPSGAKQLQMSTRTQDSFLKEDTTGSRVYGRGTGSAPAMDNMPPDILPAGHNTIGTGNKHCPVKHKDAMRMPKSMEDKMESMGMEG